MDLSLILTWSGVPFFFLSLSFDLVYLVARHDSFHSSGYSVLGMMESYSFLLSILLRACFTSAGFTQSLISQGIYAIFGNFIFSFIVFLQLENNYNFFEIIPTGVKIICIISWLYSNIIFGLIAGDKFPYEIRVDNKTLSGYFYIDAVIIIISLSKFIHTVNRLKSVHDFSRFSMAPTILLLIGSSLWSGSLLFESLTSGPSSLLLNLGKAGISISSLIQCLSLLILKKRFKTQQYYQKYDSVLIPSVMNSFS